MISATDIPFSSYVAHPRTPLHRVDARIKQAWLLGLVFVIPRAPWQLKLGLVVATAALAVTCLPRRLSAAQLSRLLPLAALICVMASLTADQTVPSVVSSMPPPELQDLPSLERLSDGYQCVPTASTSRQHGWLASGTEHLGVRRPARAFRGCCSARRYTFFSFAFLSVSRFSLGLGASAGAVTFALLQLTATFLVTTPPEQMALSFRWFLSPLRLVGVPVERATFRLLLALRFVSLVRTRPSIAAPPSPPLPHPDWRARFVQCMSQGCMGRGASRRCLKSAPRALSRSPCRSSTKSATWRLGWPREVSPGAAWRAAAASPLAS